MLFVNKRMKDSSTLSIWIYPTCNMVGMMEGGLAQLARALALHARGHRFESDILHTKKT